MNAVQGTPVNINGRTGGTPGPAPNASPLRVGIPMPPGRQIGGVPFQPATTFARLLTIRNYDAAVDLRIRFYDSSYVSVKAGTEKEFVGPIPFFTIQAASATVEWDATAIVAG